MVRGISAQTRSHIIEMIPSDSDKAMERFPAGAIAQAWLNEYSEQLTWTELKKWLEACPRLLDGHPAKESRK
jgi:hypothetical protein